MQPRDPDHTPGPEDPTVEPPRPVRRLTRSRGDRVIGGVAGGLGRYFNADPILFRLGFVLALAFGGAGAVLYVAALLLVPDDGAEAAGPPSERRHRTLVVVGVIALVVVAGPVLFAIGGVLLPFALLVLLALGAAWAVTGRKPEGDAAEVARAALIGTGVLILLFVLAVAAGWVAAELGGTAIAIAVIAAGVALVVGAFARPARWLILPALAVALPAAFVAAAGIELDGGYGEKRYRPAAAADVRERYEIGAGRLVVDLRDADLPAGDRGIDLHVGMGEAVLLVADDVCVTTDADIGMGGVEVFGRDSGGVDLDWEDRRTARRGAARVVVDADIGVGALWVGAGDGDASRYRWDGSGDEDDDGAAFAASPAGHGCA